MPPSSQPFSRIVFLSLALAGLIPTVMPVGANDSILDRLLAEPGAMAREWDAMVASRDHAYLWQTAMQEQSDFLGPDFAAWLRDRGGSLPAEVRPTVAMMAVRYDSKEAVPPLLEWLRAAADDAFVRETVLYALGRLGAERAIAAIEALPADTDEWTRFFAREALDRIRGQWREPDPFWAGTNGLAVAVVGRGLDGHAYRQFMAREFGGECAFFQVQIHFTNGSGGWVARDGATRFAEALTVNADGTPRFPIVILHGVIPTEVTPFLSWRLLHYARRGARIVFDQPTYFGTFYQMRTMGDVVRTFRYRPGPWDALFPDGMQRDPLFPSIDGLPSGVKTAAFGYRAIGRGGSLVMAPHSVSLGGARQAGLNNIAGWTTTRQPPEPDAEALWAQVFGWLSAGPAWQPVTVDWRNEPVVGTRFRAGTPIPITLALTWHTDRQRIVASAVLADSGGEIVAERRSDLMDGVAKQQIELAFDVTPSLLASIGVYRLTLAAQDADGRFLHRIERELNLLGRFNLALEDVPAAVSTGAMAQVRLTIEDTASGPLPGGQLRLRLRDEDRNRSVLPITLPWDGPAERVSTVAVPVVLPDTLPVGQYTLVAEVGDTQGRTFARAEAPLAVQARYRDRHLFLWSEWSQYNRDTARAEAGRRLGLNTTWHWGGWARHEGFPYEYAVINPPQIARGVRLGDMFLDPEDSRNWLRHGEHSLANARAVSVNLIEEIEIGEHWQAGAQGRRDQYRYFLEDHLHTVAALNERIGGDIVSWDELPFVNSGGAGLNVMFRYAFRNSVLKMRGDWLREMNPHLHIEPGMGVGLWGDNTYDGMHMRGYVNYPTAWFPGFRVRALPAYGRAPLTWLVGMHWRPHVWQQGRVVWSAIAAGGRHILNYAPGDRYGASLFNADLSLTAPGEAYRRVIERVRPYEPILGQVQNQISDTVCSISWGGDYMTQNDVEPAIDALFHLGIFPNETADVASYALILDSHSPGGVDTAAVRRAVESGAVLLSTARTRRQLAESFGVRFDQIAITPDTAVPLEGDEQAEAIAETVKPDTASKTPVRVSLDALAQCLPAVRGASLYGVPGPATGATADSGLTVQPGLIFGQVGRGLFIYVNTDSRFGGYFWGDGLRHDLAGWTRLIEAILERQGVGRAPAKAIDALGRSDARIFTYVLDTDDAAQQYLLLQANHVLEGSLSGWGIDDRAPEVYAAFAQPGGKPLAGPADRIVLEWNQVVPADAMVWVRRKAERVPDHPAPAARFVLRRDGNIQRPLGVPGNSPDEPIGHLRAAVPSPDYLWETVGLVLPLDPGRYELTVEGLAGRETSIDRILVLPAVILARVAFGDPTVAALYDHRDRQIYPVREEQGLRIADVPVRPGDAALLALLPSDAGQLHVGTERAVAEAGQPLAVTLELRDAQGRGVARSATCMARLLGPDGEPVAGSERRILLDRGQTRFDFWTALEDPRGDVRLRVEDLTTGHHTDIPLRLQPSGEEHAPGPDVHRKSIAPFEIHVEALPDLRAVDLAVVTLGGRIDNRTPAAVDVRLSVPLPDSVWVTGPESLRLHLPPQSVTPFAVPVLLTREQVLAVRDRDLAIPLSVRGEDGESVAETRVRILVNSWNTTPAFIGTRSSGSEAGVILLNATDHPVQIQLAITPSGGIAIEPGGQTVTVPARQTATARVVCRLSNPPPGDGMYPFTYTVSVGQARCDQGVLRVGVRTETDWWLTARDALPKLDSAPGILPVASDSVTGGIVDDLISEIGLADEGAWTPLHDVFRAAAPPDGWRGVRSGTALDFQAQAPGTAYGAIIMAATRIVSPRDTEVTLRVGRETQDYVWLDGKLVDDRRSGDTRRQPLPGGTFGHFAGRIWLNGRHVYGVRADRANLPPPDPAVVRLKAGVNEVLVQYAVQTDNDGNPGRLFLFLHDAADGTRLRDLIFAMDGIE